MSAKHFWVKTVYALFFIVLLIATVLFALNVKHDTPAFGDNYALKSVEYTVVANDLNLPSETEYDSFEILLFLGRRCRNQRIQIGYERRSRSEFSE